MLAGAPGRLDLTGSCRICWLPAASRKKLSQENPYIVYMLRLPPISLHNKKKFEKSFSKIWWFRFFFVPLQPKTNKHLEIWKRNLM